MTFKIKDSGERVEFDTGMRRDTNAGKPRYDLIIPVAMKPNMLERWASHMANGAIKYGDRNWELAETQEEYNRFLESAIRHFMSWFMGERDEDHAAAIFFNVQAAEYVRQRMGGKDE